MRFKSNSVAILALLVSTAATAQVQPATPTQPGGSRPSTTMPDEPAPAQSTAPGQIQTTPGQAQTTPGAASQLTPAQSGQTPSGQAVAATASDVKSGVSVYDQNGGLVGKVESVSSKGAVINTGTVKASIPVSSFAKNDKGLVIAMSKADIDAAAKKSSAKPK